MSDPFTIILLAAALYILGSAFTARFVSFNEDSAPESGDTPETTHRP